MAGRAGKIALSGDKGADALQRFFNGAGQYAHLIITKAVRADTFIVINRQLFYIDIGHGVGQLHHRGDGPAHHQQAKTKTQYPQGADHSADHQQQPPVFRRGGLYTGYVKHHKSRLLGVCFDYRHMQLLRFKLVNARSGVGLCPVLQRCRQAGSGIVTAQVRRHHRIALRSKLQLLYQHPIFT